MSKFKVNQVWQAYGGGNARIVDVDLPGAFPIRAMFLGNGRLQSYTEDGKWAMSGYPLSAFDLVRLVEEAAPLAEPQPESVMLLEGDRVPVPEIDSDTPAGDEILLADPQPESVILLEGDRLPVPEIDSDTPASGKVLVAEGYESLADVLQRAFQQAANGKGKERHASTGVAFENQPMSTINDLLGSVDGYLYQAMKKATEARRLPPGRDVAELLGAINYLAGAVLHIERNRVTS